jgi:hypothetical protein
MALKWNQFLSVRNPYADVLEFTLTEYVRIGPNSIVPVPYLEIKGSTRFRTVRAVTVADFQLCVFKLDYLTLVIENLQYKMKRMMASETK